MSFLWRLSRANRVPLLAAARALGVVGRRGQRFQPAFVMEPGPPVVAAWGGDDEALRGMFLSRYDHVFGSSWSTGSLREFALTEWVHVGSSPICPACLGEGAGHWRISWRVPFVFMCLEHRALLSNECPGCATPHGTGRRDGSITPTFVQFIGDTRECRNAAQAHLAKDRASAKRPCGHDLTSIPLVLVDDERVVRAQHVILDILEGRVAPTVGGQEVGAREWFYDLRTLCAWLRYAGSADLATGLGGSVVSAWSEMCAQRDAAVRSRKGLKGSLDRTFSRTPTAVEMLVTATHAVPILLESHPEALRGRVQDLLESEEEGVAARSRTLRYRAPNSLPLKTAIVEATIPENYVHAYLASHPKRAPQFLSSDSPAIDIGVLERHVPEVLREVHGGLLLPGFELMVRFFRDRDAKTWSDAIAPHDPSSVNSIVLRLVNVASKAGAARKLARSVVDVATGAVGTGQSSPPSAAAAAFLTPSARGAHEDPDFGVQYIPALLWPDAYKTRFAALFDGYSVTEETARAALSVHLVALLTDRSDDQALETLDMVVPEAQRAIREALMVLRGQPGLAAIERDLVQVATSSEKIDFAERRQKFGEFTRLPTEDWAHIAASVGMGGGQPGGRDAFAATRVWSSITSGNWRYSPAMLARTGLVKGSHDLYKKFVKTAPVGLLDILDRYAAFLADGGKLGAFASTWVAGHAPSSTPLGCGFESRHVPQLFWQDSFEVRFKRFFGGLDVGDKAARAALSIMLMERAVSMSRAEMGDIFELPDRFVMGGVSRAIQLVRASAGAGELERELNLFADEFADDPAKVDFRSRRELLWWFTDIPAADWTEIASASGVSKGKSGGRSVQSAAWLWAHLTQGDVKRSPALRSLRHDRSSITTVHGAFVKKWLPPLRDQLLKFGEELISAVSQ